MKTEELEPMTTNPEDLNENGYINPFRQDFSSMGTQIGKNVTIMHMNFPDGVADYITVIDTLTGKRIRITFDR